MRLVKKIGNRLGTILITKENTMGIYVTVNSTVEYGTPEYEAAKAQLQEKVDAFNAALDEAIEIANQYGLEFHIEPTYGMGGTYSGQGKSESPEREYDEWDDDSWGWYASSQSC